MFSLINIINVILILPVTFIHLYNSFSYTKLPCLNIELHFGKYKTSISNTKL